MYWGVTPRISAAPSESTNGPGFSQVHSAAAINSSKVASWSAGRTSREVSGLECAALLRFEASLLAHCCEGFNLPPVEHADLPARCGHRLELALPPHVRDPLRADSENLNGLSAGHRALMQSAFERACAPYPLVHESTLRPALTQLI